MKELKDIPIEVQEVWIYQAYVHYCGSETMDKLQATIRKYPEYFPWETTYNNIPQEVHDVYREEKYKIRIVPKTTTEIFKDIMRSEEEYRKIKEETRLKNETLWNKHYGKYNLKYRGN